MSNYGKLTLKVYLNQTASEVILGANKGELLVRTRHDTAQGIINLFDRAGYAIHSSVQQLELKFESETE